MRIAVGIAVVLAGLTIGAWLWLGKPAAPAVPAVRQSVGHASEVPEPVELQQPELPAAEELPPTVLRETASLSVIQSEPAKPSGTVTLLRVHLLAKEDRTPQLDRRLLLEAADDRGSGCLEVPGRRGRLGKCPSTDKDGWAEFEVEPGRDHWIDGAGLHDHFRIQEVPALGQGELREIEILVQTQDDVILFGVLVDAESSGPVVDGTLQIEGDRTFQVWSRDPDQPDHRKEHLQLEGPPVRVGPDGRFQLAGKSWMRRFVSVTAPGYARTVFSLAPGHSTAADPLEVRMSRSATLEVLVNNSPGAPIMDVLVELEAQSHQLAQKDVLSDYYYADALWTASTDALGIASVGDLPPKIPLKLSLFKTGMGRQAQSEPLILEPGKQRRIEIVWGAGGRVRGQVLDGNGNPVAKRKLWRVLSETTQTSAVILGSYPKPAAFTKTDEHGAFQFEDVPVGRWCIGLAPSNVGGSSAFPAYAEVVEMKTPGDTMELVLRVDAGLYLRGKVVDPSDVPVRGCYVMGFREGSSMQVTDQTDAQGAFKLGPLPRGEWTLHALELGGENASPESMQVQAGTEGIVLRMAVGASIAGKLVKNSDAEPVEYRVALNRTDSEGFGAGDVESRNGEFKFGGLEPGTYIISARDRAGSIGVSRVISLVAGQALKDVEIELVRGATLRLRYEGESKHASYVIFAGGLPINSNILETGESEVECVPAGAVEVRWTSQAPEAAKTEAITILAGEVRDLVWDGKP